MIIFRVDGNSKIGLGHIMRCLSIAEALREKYIESLFVLADIECSQIIEQKGFMYEVLDSQYDNMNEELYSFLKVIDKYSPKVIIVDSYYVSGYYLRSIRSCAKTVYIDDLLAFAYPVDILINYNIFSSVDKYESLYELANERPLFLLGTKYVPLRSEFADCVFRNPSTTVRNILITTGGADTLHISLTMLQYLKEHNETKYDSHFFFVIGSANHDIEKIEELAAELPFVSIKRNINNICELMSVCDLAVSAAGSTLYELCVCCVPTITFVVADNQLPAAKIFSQQGLLEYLGDMREMDNIGESITDAIYKLCKDYQRRFEYIRQSYNAVFVDGAKNIAEELCYYSNIKLI